MITAKTISVVIPTHNRASLLSQNLTALGHQTWPASDFEVIVVADTCADETASIVLTQSQQVPYDLRLIEHEARSAAATRNLGAAQATGQYLLFLDDDIVPEPELVESHATAGAPNTVVLGYSKPLFPAQGDWWQIQARWWWEDAFREMGRPGHRFTFRDFFSGNVSLPAELFRSLGGFDQSNAGRLEDYELGIRLIEAGATFRYVPEAIGWHKENTNLDIWLRRQRNEALANIQMGYNHPALRLSLFQEYLIDYPSRYDRAMRGLRALCFRRSEIASWLRAALLPFAHLSERLRWRGPYWYASRALRELAYWGGVAERFKTEKEFRAYLKEASDLDRDMATIDLVLIKNDNELDEILQAANRKGVIIAVNGVEIARIPTGYGSESMRVGHLHQQLLDMAGKRFYPWPAFQQYLFSLAEKR